MQLGIHLADGLVDQLVGLGRGHLLGDHVAGRLNGDGHSLVAHFFHSRSFCRRDLTFGCRDTTGDGFFQIFAGFFGRDCGFFLGCGDDPVSLFLNFFLLALVAGQQGLGLFAQGAGFFQFGFDT